MKIEAIIFDLDGVITDTAKYHFVAWAALAKELGIKVSEQMNEQLKGLSRKKSLEKIFEIGGKELLSPEQMDSLTDKKNKHYQSLLLNVSEADILPGVKDFMKQCKQENIKIAVGSASKNAPLILEQLGIIDQFDVVVDGNCVEHSKPNPEVFLKAAKKMKVQPQNSVVFEDAISGVEAANRGSFFSVGVGDRQTLQHADVVIKNMSNFHLKQLNNLVNKTINA